MRAGDPVIYWRTIHPENGQDRGGVVGIGQVISTETQDEEGIRRFPTQVTFFNDSSPLPRDEVIRAGGIVRSNWRGAVLSLTREETERLDKYFRDKQLPGLLEHDRGTPITVETHDTEYISDRPETDKDLLNRAPLAFALAYNINKIWSVQTASKKTKGRGWLGLNWLRLASLNRQAAEADEAAFILHLDAPWGGGKTTFANFIARILNPVAYGYDTSDKSNLTGSLLNQLPLHDERYWDSDFAKRRWFIVDFNAWQNEHVSPPWWNFYESIRRQCLHALLFEPGRFEGIKIWRIMRRLISWLRLQLAEFIWRVASPEMRNAIILLLVSGLALWWVVYSEWFSPVKQLLDENAASGKTSILLKGIFSLAGVAVTGGAGLTLVNAFRSGLKSIIDNAGKSTNAASLGEADPIQKFRRHFGWFVNQLDQPVLVIVDDLDRCSPKYVVELVRGLLTIFRSPKVVFVLLGDKDWIETAFAKVHQEMADVYTDAQITFGGRFAEKAIQLSFLLPESDIDAREAYLSAILKKENDAVPETLRDTVAALQKVEVQARSHLAATERAEEQEAAAKKTENLIREASAETATEHRAAFEKAANRILNRERMLRAATARSSETVVRQHGLKPLQGYLPANPRRIKRIINMVCAYQASALSTQGVRQGSDKWKQLVIWVVIMSEYPQIWKKLVTDSGRSEELLALIKASKKGEDITLPRLAEDASNTDRLRHDTLTALLATPGLTALLRGDAFVENEDSHSPACIDSSAREWLRRLTPLN